MNIIVILIIIAVVFLLMTSNIENFDQNRCDVQRNELLKVNNDFNGSCVNQNLNGRIDQHNNRFDCRNIQDRQIVLNNQVDYSCNCDIESNLLVNEVNLNDYNNFQIKLD